MKRWQTIIGLSLTFASVSCSAQVCARSGAPGWSKQLRQLSADCQNIITAPNGKTTALVDEKGDILLRFAGHSIPTSATITPPGVLSWSPRSQAFFLNDGDGSGMASRFRLFRIEGQEAKESSEIEKAVVRFYRQQHHCGDVQADPNVYGIGWSPDGQQIYLVAQSTVNEPCGRPDQFLGFAANTSRDTIVTYLTTQQAKARFTKLLPKELLDSK